MTTKLSVMIPVYNEVGYLPRIIQRVQAVGLHYEIVIVDDGSTDGTREMLMEWAEKQKQQRQEFDWRDGVKALLYILRYRFGPI